MFNVLSFDIKRANVNKNYSNPTKIMDIKIKIISITDNLKTTFEYLGNDFKINEKLILLFLCFNYRFQIEQIERMFENKYINPFLSYVFCKNIQNFKNITLNKDHIISLLSKAENFNIIEQILLLNDNFLDLLESINNRNFFISEISFKSNKPKGTFPCLYSSK